MKDYYLCTSEFVDLIKPAEVSKPFKSGYNHDKDDLYYVAVVDFDEANTYYESHKKQLEGKSFWCRECVPGTMDVSKISVAGIKRNGLFKEIEYKIGLTTEYNVAMTIFNLSHKYNCNPIEFINKINNDLKDDIAFSVSIKGDRSGYLGPKVFIAIPGNKEAHYKCLKCHSHNIVIGFSGTEVNDKCFICCNSTTIKFI